jgi:hypothetical protein
MVLYPLISCLQKAKIKNAILRRGNVFMSLDAKNDESDAIIIAKEIRAESLDFLEPQGFFLPNTLPLPDITRELRPKSEIVGRAMAMQTLFLYVALAEEQETAQALQDHVTRNGLTSYFTPGEALVFALPRAQATVQYQGSVGWLLEGLWSIAWVLGYAKKPTLDAEEITNVITQEIFLTFLPEVGTLLDDFFHSVTLRHVDEIITLEDRFFCARHAFSLSKQEGKPTFKTFQSSFYGSIITERQQALQWCLSPGKPWGGLATHE